MLRELRNVTSVNLQN